MTDTSSLIGGMMLSMGAVMVVMFLVYFVLIFFLGLMFYYFTGSKPGKSLLAGLGRVVGRLYAQIWMFGGLFVGLFGMYSLFKAILGALFSDFVYYTYKYSTTNPAQESDLKTGLILLVFALVIYIVHWVFNYLIERKEDRKESIMLKLFTGAGLLTSSFMFFFSLLTLLIQLVQYVGESNSAVKPGDSLAMMMGAFPIWLVYVLKSVMQARQEK